MNVVQALNNAANLDAFLRAKSIALVGATERSIWSNATFRNFGDLGFKGKVHPVNPKGGFIHGLAAATSCQAIGEVVDAALLMVPMDVIPEAFADLNAAGIRNAVVLTSGFAEMGSEGARRQADLKGHARTNGITLLGPNCLGFINLVDKIPIWTIPLPSRLAGSVAVVSQSGATAAYIADFAGRQGVGLSYIVSTGNEVDLNVARVVDYLVDDPATKVIAIFLETSRAAETLASAAHRALQAGKPIVALKIGTSEITAKAAQAHTGSLVGDDRVFSAACHQLGIIRVDSIEAMVATAALLAQVKPITKPKAAAIAISGGVCEIASDRFAALGVTMTPFAEKTVDDLREIMPAFGTPHNPLDVTGAAMLKPQLFEDSLKVLGRDPEVGLIAGLFDLPDGDEDGFANAVAKHLGTGLNATGLPGVLVSVAPKHVPEKTLAVARANNIAYLGSGVHHGLSAIANAFWWSERQGKPFANPLVERVAGATSCIRPGTERETLDYLEQAGVPTVPARIAKSAKEAAAAAESFGGAVVLKIASPDIAHKSDIGGVRLNVRGPEAAAEAYDGIITAVRAARPDAALDGMIVSPMRAKGLELFVGVLRDPQWGPAIAVGLGGIWVEALKDTSLRLLPVAPSDVLEMLGELRSSRLLDGYRGSPPVDRQAIAEVVARIGDAALALGPDLVSLEINPLLATDERVEALDGLAVWDDDASEGAHV